ncbi:MAG: DUF4239 domain-containing protein [Chthoniobacterales bacterium]
MTELLHVPPWLFGSIIVIVFIVSGVFGLAAFNWLIRDRIHLTETMNNDIIFFASAISVFYSLIVGLTAVGVWKAYTDAQNLVSEEATAIGCFYRDIGGYAEPTRTELQHEIRTYTDFLITVAWPKQIRGEATDEATRMLTKLEQDLVAYEPKTAGQQILHAQALHEYNEIAGLRRKRLHVIGVGLPSVMWSVVLLGAALVMCVTYLLRVQQTVQFVLTGCLAMFIGLVVFVIASLDRPLSGPLAIDSKPYQIVRDRLIDLK